MDAGELIIKTVINNDKFEKQYKKLEAKIKNKEIDIDIKTGDLENVDREIQRLEQKLAELQKEREEFREKGWGTEVFDSRIDETYDAIIKQYDTWLKINGELEKQENGLDEIKQKIKQIQLQETQEGLKTIKKGFGDTLKTVGKMGLAIFGIRSAYNVLRNAMSDISKYNSDVANTLTYARTMLSTALEPIIVRIVGWLKQLMALINYISKRWFGRDLFADTDKNLKKLNKTAGALKKTLAGFDEMNILNSSSTGGGGGISTDLDLDKYEKDAEQIYKRTSKYLFGGENLWESFKTGFQGAWDDILALIDPFGGIWLRDIVMPMIRLTNQGVAKLLPELAPYWEEIIKNSDGTLSEMEILWLGFKDYLKDKILKPIEQSWEDTKRTLMQIGVNVVNFFIRKINDTFGIFGIHLDEIELETEKTGKEIEDNLATPLDEINNTEYKVNIVTSTVNNVKNILSEIWGYLTGMTKKRWDITALFKGSTSGGNSWAKGGVYYPHLPKLAVGGIVNQPGRGIPYHGAIVGERGAEGILPLTDSQQMELLGATIGRYITINNTNPIYMNGRLIAKEINRSNAEDDFAFNR